MVYHCKAKPQILRKTEDLREETWLFSQTFCLSPRWGASISVAPSRKWESGFTLNIAVLTFAGFKNRITGIERTSRDFFSDIPLFHSGPSWALHPVYPVCPDAEEDTSHSLVEWAGCPGQEMAPSQCRGIRPQSVLLPQQANVWVNKLFLNQQILA